jgi:hypothetical protein
VKLRNGVAFGEDRRYLLGMDTASTLKKARLDAGMKQLVLETRIRELFPGHPGRLPCRQTISEIENGRRPLATSWALLRAALPGLPEME